MREQVTMSPREYAKHANIGIYSVYKMTKIKGFPHIKIGRYNKILVKDADEWLKTQIEKNLLL